MVNLNKPLKAWSLMQVSSQEMAPKPWGPDNPHPLSTRRTELVWEGKYDEYGNLRNVSLPNFPLVLQKIETIDAPRDEAQAQGALFETATAHRDDFRNRLVWGDNKLVLASLLEEFRGRVDLVYIDPPFDVGADFTVDIAIGEDGVTQLLKQQSILETVAYRDTWGRGRDSYVSMMHDRLVLAREALAEKGVILVHCDWRVSGDMRALLDDVFTPSWFRNEIIWRRGHINTRTASNQFPRNHDTIFIYRSPSCTYNRQFKPYSDSTMSMYRADDNDGRGPYRLQSTRTYSEDSIAKMEADNRIVRSQSGTVSFKQYLSEKEGVVVDDVWDDVHSLQGNSEERLDYDTQKPEALLRRIIGAFVTEDSLVMDFFCGSGTTLAVAERTGCKWIGVDLGRYAVHISRKRLIGVQRELHKSGKPYRSFDVYNLGRYERQWWQQERLRGADEEHRAAVLKFFKASPLDNSPSPLLHATKGGAYVYVDEIDGLFTRSELDVVARDAARIGARELVCLSWEFEMHLADMARNLGSELGIKIRLTYIPREIMEANRSEVQFFDASVLKAEAVVKSAAGHKTIDVRLTGFWPSLGDVPEKEIAALQERAVNSPFDFIDFWAVDFEYDEKKPFEHHWQDYRTRKDRRLLKESTCAYRYATSGKKKICVKLIDVFGVDTSTVVEVDL
jgi:adenine-specific DNA-methyltransferase